MPQAHEDPFQVALLNETVDGGPTSLLAITYTLLLSSRSIIEGRRVERLAVSDITVSGVAEVPAKFVQPVVGSHLKDRIWAEVVGVYAQASRMSPL